MFSVYYNNNNNPPFLLDYNHIDASNSYNNSARLMIKVQPGQLFKYLKNKNSPLNNNEQVTV